MKRNRLSDRQLRALKPGRAPFHIPDGAGLEIEVRPSGAMSWRLRLKIAGKEAKLNLGRYPAVPLAAARAKSRAIVAAAGDRMDHWRITLKEFAERYLSEIVTKNRKNPKPIRRYFERDIYPVIGSKPLISIGRSELQKLIYKRRDEGYPHAAMALRNLLKRLWEYAIQCGITEANPPQNIDGKFIVQTKSRDRALSDAELAQFLKSLESCAMRSDLKSALRLILLTLTRKAEVQLARWQEFTLLRAEWEIPAERSKTDMAQIVYLSRQAVELLKSLRDDRTLPPDAVFPMRYSRMTPMSATTLNRALAAMRLKIKHFTIHDLRRTAATRLSELGWAPDVIEKALNHKIAGVRGIYNRAQYAEQRREMLQAWADHLDSLLIQPGST